jgi:hypothetical protein
VQTNIKNFFIPGRIFPTFFPWYFLGGNSTENSEENALYKELAPEVMRRSAGRCRCAQSRTEWRGSSEIAAPSGLRPQTSPQPSFYNLPLSRTRRNKTSFRQVKKRRNFFSLSARNMKCAQLHPTCMRARDPPPPPRLPTEHTRRH